MVHMMIDVPEEALSVFRTAPDAFAREMRLAAAVKWYELRRISQDRAAKIAGVSRAEFMDSLKQFNVSPFQSSAEEILDEACRE